MEFQPVHPTGTAEGARKEMAGHGIEPQRLRGPVHPILHLQHTMGNQAVVRLLHARVIQTKPESDTEPSEVPASVHETFRSSGQPLDSATRTFMGQSFGHDFSRVRIHAEAKAVESARALSALAYTVGSDVVFGQGQYAPGTAAGNHLLAHELTHTLQQRQMSGPFSPMEDARLEMEAEMAAASAMNGSPIRNLTGGPVIQTMNRGDVDGVI